MVGLKLTRFDMIVYYFCQKDMQHSYFPIIFWRFILFTYLRNLSFILRDQQHTLRWRVMLKINGIILEHFPGDHRTSPNKFSSTLFFANIKSIHKIWYYFSQVCDVYPICINMKCDYIYDVNTYVYTYNIWLPCDKWSRMCIEYIRITHFAVHPLLV